VDWAYEVWDDLLRKIRNLHGDNRQAIATFDGNFILLLVGLGAD